MSVKLLGSLLVIWTLLGGGKVAFAADERVEQLLLRIEMLEARLAALESGAEPTAALVPAAVVAPAATDQAADAEGEALLSSTVDVREQERLVRAAFESTLVDRGGLLLSPWSFDIEPSLGYGVSASERIVIDGFSILPVLVVGDIVSERIRRERLEAVTTARLGLPGDLQIDLSLPYVHEEFQVVTAENEESIVADQGFGDLSVGLSWQVHRSRGRMPDLLAGVTWKSDSGSSPFAAGPKEIAFGSGYHGLRARLNAVKVVDPVVFFGGINYQHNFETEKEIGSFDPGDSFGFNVGMAIALNLNTSLNLSYDQISHGHSRLDGVELPGSDGTLGVASFGGSYAAPGFAVDFSVGIGITEEAPDLLARFAVPFRFRN